MQIAAQPKGWSDSEVDQALASLSVIEAESQAVSFQLDLLTVFVLTLGVFVVAQFIWHACGLFFPNTRQLIGDD